jgi:hypothetical protein
MSINTFINNPQSKLSEAEQSMMAEHDIDHAKWLNKRLLKETQPNSNNENEENAENAGYINVTYDAENAENADNEGYINVYAEEHNSTVNNFGLLSENPSTTTPRGNKNAYLEIGFEEVGGLTSSSSLTTKKPSLTTNYPYVTTGNAPNSSVTARHKTHNTGQILINVGGSYKKRSLKKSNKRLHKKSHKRLHKNKNI